MSSIFIYVFCLNPINRKWFVYVIVVGSMIVGVIVILQNFRIVPFLWSDLYRSAYSGFNSGTLGPNKIVLGMTSFIVFVLSIGVYLEKSIRINKTVIIVSIALNLYIVMLSGSRTAYLALLIFLIYFAVFSTLKFSYVTILVLGLFFLTININGDLFKKIDEVISNRVTDKIKNKESIEEGKVGELYSDLGSGRDRLSTGNLYYLLENPQIIPFGMGFVNRFSNAPGLSAHNMYIQVVRELGIVGFVLYFGWLLSYLFIDFKQFKGFSLALKGLIFSMLVTLFFGEHLYIYRPLFGFLGLFLVISNIFVSILHKNE
ncbi:O-antigen ligase family protein [Flavobacterium laiguense]|uniref:O-antigen ligase family protein n=1 Tax=Flavobacterium laiguense TaxID=2169409 RepID=UPI001670A19A|nr:O-antigen ligase family protein [Flavobacterium laiguense]